jgi:diacylglycerol kinase (ATP)
MPRRRLLSFKYAFQGVAYLLRTQPNARIHAAALLLAVTAGMFFSISPGEWLAVVLASALVLALEAVNTAVEALTDLVSPGPHPLAGAAKDVAAAAVLIAAMGAAVVGSIVFLPKIYFCWTNMGR